METHISENPVSQFDKREQDILDKWEKATKKITEGVGTPRDLKEVARNWRQLARIANEYASLAEEIRGRGK